MTGRPLIGPLLDADVLAVVFKAGRGEVIGSVH